MYVYVSQDAGICLAVLHAYAHDRKVVLLVTEFIYVAQKQNAQQTKKHTYIYTIL